MLKVNMLATGLSIKQKCEEFGYTPKKLSDMFDTSTTTPYLWMSGKVMPRLDFLVTLCKLFNCTMEELLVVDEVDE